MWLFVTMNWPNLYIMLKPSTKLQKPSVPWVSVTDHRKHVRADGRVMHIAGHRAATQVVKDW